MFYTDILALTIRTLFAVAYRANTLFRTDGEMVPVEIETARDAFDAYDAGTISARSELFGKPKIDHLQDFRVREGFAKIEEAHWASNQDTRSALLREALLALQSPEL